MSSVEVYLRHKHRHYSDRSLDYCAGDIADETQLSSQMVHKVHRQLYGCKVPSAISKASFIELCALIINRDLASTKQKYQRKQK